MPLHLLLGRLTAPVEIRRVLRALDAEKQRIDSVNDGLLGPSVGYDVVKPRVAEYILKWSDDVKKDVVSGKSPTVVALYILMHIARDDLYHGTHHLRQGYLSMTGNAVHALNNYCCDELRKARTNNARHKGGNDPSDHK
jgi:hypothetical protein